VSVGENGLHVVFGTGQVGRALTAHLLGLGLPVRVVSRRRAAGLPPAVDWRGADAADTEAASDAAHAAAVIYQCLNAPYAKWAALFPPLQRGVLAAAERSGALLVSLENLYAYGPAGGDPMTEDLALAAITAKGRTRATMTQELLAARDAGRVQIAIGRASDFFGPGVTDSTLGARVFGNALAGRRTDFIGNPDLLHTYSYVPDIAAGLATLGTDDRAIDEVWHLPGPETVTTRQILDLVGRETGHPVGIRSVSKLALRALGLVNPTMRALVEMAYEFDEPFVLDTTKSGTPSAWQARSSASPSPPLSTATERPAPHGLRPQASQLRHGAGNSRPATDLLSVTADLASEKGHTATRRRTVTIEDPA
jgi:nucleoside-diphosphate-sugar epimerase